MKINCQAFLEIKKILSIKSLNAVVEQFCYDETEKEIKGNIKVTTICYVDNLETTSEFFDDVPFNVMLVKDEFEKDNLDLFIENLLYHPVEGRGIELEFDICLEEKKKENKEIDGEEIIEVPVLVETPAEPLTNRESNDEKIASDELGKAEERENPVEEKNNDEEIKDQVVEDVDNLLKSKLEQALDNFPAEENSFLDHLDRPYRRIKISFSKKPLTEETEHQKIKVVNNHWIAIDEPE